MPSSKSVFRRMLVVILPLGAMAPAFAAGPALLDSASVREWREDLSFLRTEMPLRHANLFHTMTPAQFDSALTAIEEGLPQRTRDEVLIDLMRLDALVGDGHSNVSAWRDTAVHFQELPVALYSFAEGLYVRAATASHGGLVGARVVGIGEVSADSALALVRPLIGRDNEMGAVAWAPVLLSMPEVLHAVGIARDPTHVRFVIEHAGRRSEVILQPVGPFPMRPGETDRSWMPRAGWIDARADHQPLWLSNPAKTYWFAMLPGTHALYCQLNAVQQDPTDSLSTFIARAIAAADSAGADRFVVDLRLNGGGSADWNRDILLPLIKSRYDSPGRLFVLMGRRTWSAAQMLLCDLENYTHPLFVGEPSASRGNHYGDSRRIVLPHSHVTVRVSSLYWQYWDPRDDRPWIAPNLPAPLTFGAYQRGDDPALEAALRFAPEPR